MPKSSDAAPKGSKQQAGARPDAGALSADQVAAYLRRHPEFLVDNPELLDGLTPPKRHDGESVIDLQSVMVERLRNEIGSLTDARDSLLTTGRTNLSAQARAHEAVVALLKSESFEHLIETVTTDLAVILDLDVVTIGVACDREKRAAAPHINGVYQLEPEMLDEVLGPTCRMILRDNVAGDPRIFGAGAGLVHSDAILRLKIGPDAPEALLALGSRQPDQFHPGQGTELLSFLGSVLECCFQRWLNLRPQH